MLVFCVRRRAFVHPALHHTTTRTNQRTNPEKNSSSFRGGARPGLLCVENPLSPSVDVGRNAFNVSNVRRAFCHAHMVLVEALVNQQAHFHHATNYGPHVRRSSKTSPAAGIDGGGGAPGQTADDAEAAEADRILATYPAPAPSSLAAVLHIDEILLERELPPRETAELFSSTLPPPPQSRFLDGNDGDMEGGGDGNPVIYVVDDDSDDAEGGASSSRKRPRGNHKKKGPMSKKAKRDNALEDKRARKEEKKERNKKKLARKRFNKERRKRELEAKEEGGGGGP